MSDRKFPFFAIIVLLAGIVWMMEGLGYLGSFPWLPAIVIILGIGMLVKFYSE
jgi:hypothetical protein